MTKFRTQLLYTSAYTPLVIWLTLWDYYHGKGIRKSPIAVTDQLREAVRGAITPNDAEVKKFSTALLLRGGNNLTPSVLARINNS